MSETEDKLRKSEERFFLAAEATDNGIWDWEIPSHKVYYSPRWKSQVGYRDDELENRFETWEELLHPDDSERMHQEVKNYLENPFGLFKAVFRLRHKNGTYRWISNSAAALLDESGKPYRMVGAHKDITEQKNWEEMLIRAKEKAEEADKLKSVFLSNMSHEIRTPMNSIIGFSNILMEDHLSQDDRKEYLRYIIKDGENLLHLLDDIIDMAKIESGQINIVPKDFKLNQYIREIYDRLSSDHEKSNKRHIKFILKLPGHSDDLVMRADPYRFKQVVCNLVNNAFKFTRKGEVEFGYQLNQPRMPLFYVRDTGPGIPEEKQELIFERFGQAETTYTRNHGGAGLGLSISRSLIKFQGGKIWLESETGKGTTFFFHLGRSISNTPEAHHPASGESSKKNDWSDKTIMVVEDIKNNYMFIEAVLKSRNVNLLHAPDGPDAISLVQEQINNIDLILMDIRLPRMNGYDVTREIKKLNPDVPIIAVTAYAIANEKDECLKAGCCDYMSKPINRTELLDLVSRYIYADSGVKMI